MDCNSINFQLPEEARELDKEVRQIIKEKEEAVRNQDFEKVMYLRIFYRKSFIQHFQEDFHLP